MAKSALVNKRRPGTSPQGKYVLCSGLATVWPCPHCCNMRLVFSGLLVSSVPKLELWGCMGGFQFKLSEAMLRLGHFPPGQFSYNIKPGGMYYMRLCLRGHGGVWGCRAPRTDLKGCAWQREWAVVQFCRNIFENNPGSEYHHNKSWLARSAESWWDLTVKPCTQPQAWVHSLVLLYVSSAFPQQYQVCVNTAVTAIASNKVGVS